MTSAAFLPPLPRSRSTFISTSPTSKSPRYPKPRSSIRRSPQASVITVLDYGAGNVRSLENAVRLLGHDIHWARTPTDISNAEKLIFPGVGSFGAAMQNLQSRNFIPALSQYINDDRPFLGICLGLHTLFESSEESPDVPGLGLWKGRVERFKVEGLGVPHIGWNVVDGVGGGERYYFVHSYRLGLDVGDVGGVCRHGEDFVAVLKRGNVLATQFHPEKSGGAGLRLIDAFLSDRIMVAPKWEGNGGGKVGGLAKRVVACLDVRENDEGDLVVTKGDQYDVREEGEVRNLGKPVELAKRYFREGADEVCFLNITSFRGEPVGELGMIEVLERTSREVFVPLCIGGGIRDYVDREGREYSALDVAAMYFRAGADKVSIGSDAVYAAERFYERGGVGDGSSSIERISHVYGAQAVVVSVDPRRVYVKDETETEHATVRLADGRVCWYQCTVKGGREGRDVDVVQLVTAVEKLGAGEILVNCMDRDGQKDGFELELIRMVRDAVSIPVIASSGAGKVEHFTECFEGTGAEAALAAGIFHREEVSIGAVKEHMTKSGTPVRLGDSVDELLQLKAGAV